MRPQNLMRWAGVPESQIWPKLLSGLARVGRAGVRRKAGLTRGPAGVRASGRVWDRMPAGPLTHNEVSITCPSLPSSCYCGVYFLKD